MITTTDGWPVNTGPLRTLERLGLHSGPERIPRWLLGPMTLDTGTSHVYVGSCKFVNKDGLRALAALTFESWNVHLKPSPDGTIRIKITAIS